MDAFSRRSSFGFSRMLPSLLLLGFVLMTGVVSVIPGSTMPPVLLAWAIIYYWALFQPAQLPLFVLGLSGLLHDLLTGFPIGVSTFGFVLLHAGVMRLRKMITAQHFTAIWAGFGVIALLQGILCVLIITLVTQRHLSDVALSLMYGVLLAWIAYPVVHIISAFIGRYLYKSSSFSAR